MKLKDLQFLYPQELIALKPEAQSRILWNSQAGPSEMTKSQLLNQFNQGDVLVINETKVIPRRVLTAGDQPLEILFLKEVEPQIWEVLFPSRRLKKNEELNLPGDVKAHLVRGGRPQLLQVSDPLSITYFETYGELAIPPYIQKARGDRRLVEGDKLWYQTAWATKPGSVAAPTASLHFSETDLNFLRSERGVEIVKLTLHVGMGTFLPVETEDLKDHVMHREQVEISELTWQKILFARHARKKIWALGTTVTRALEAQALGAFPLADQSYLGETDLLIQEGFQFQVVDVLMTNFHQPGSTLLALVAGFAGLDRAKTSYQWAIEKQFRLFSYGDLSVWQR